VQTGSPRRALRPLLFACVTLLGTAPALLPAVASAQASAATTPAMPQGPLTLKDAVARALADGTTARLSAQEPLRTEGERRVAHAALLPTIDVGATESQTRTNLKAIGFNFPGVPSVLGPFGTFEARIRAAVNLVDVAARRRAHASDQSVTEARAAREADDLQVAGAVATLYVSLEGAEASVHAAESNLVLFDDLRKLARDQWRQGVATRLDSLRAELRWSRQSEVVLESRTQRDDARFALLHALALPGDTPLVLADTLADDDATTPTAEEALARARSRPEVRQLDARIAAAELSVRAASAERLPRLGVSAEGMLNGPDPSDLEPVHVLSAGVSMPLFDGGRISGETAIARVDLERARIARTEFDRQLDEDVRRAVVALSSAGERVRVARQAESVGLEELRVARSRFASGVSTNLEVDNAQTSLATAREDRVRALADRAQARYDLARATGSLADLTRTTP
jgi:outer membrane protein